MEVVRKITKLVWCAVLVCPIFIETMAQDTDTANGTQTKNDAILAFNKGLEAKQAEDYHAALASFNEALKIAREVGVEAEEVVINIEGQMPGLYYQMAMELYNEKKIDAAIEKFAETIEIAHQYNDEAAAEKARKATSQLFYYKGATEYQSENFKEALGYFTKATEYHTENTKAWYMIAACYKGLEDDENLKSAAQKAAEFAKASNDSRYYENSVKLAGDYFLVKGNNAKKSEKYDEAEKYLNYSLEFDGDNAAANFLLTQVYNAQSKWDQAIEAANNTLAHEKDDPVAKAKIYYELGNALKNQGKTGEACDAYRKAAVGQFKESSEYIIEHELDCN